MKGFWINFSSAPNYELRTDADAAKRRSIDELRITSHQSPITDHQSPITNH